MSLPNNVGRGGFLQPLSLFQFGDSQKLRLVRILRSTVMVRVGGGWVALDEFLVKNDPCRGKRSLYHLLGPWWNREGGCWNQFFPVYILCFWCLLLKYLSIIWVLYNTFNVPHEYFHILFIRTEQFILLLKQSSDYYYKGMGYKCPLINCVSEKSILTVQLL